MADKRDPGQMNHIIRPGCLNHLHTLIGVCDVALPKIISIPALPGGAEHLITRPGQIPAQMPAGKAVQAGDQYALRN